MNILLIFLCVVTHSILRINGVEENEWKLSREDVDAIENQIQIQNNNTIKTIRTHHGDVYDCVSFYKQPAFHNPLVKDRDFSPQNKPYLSFEKARNNVYSRISPELGLNSGGCPVGSVPIKRHTKEDLIRIKIALESRSRANGELTHDATCHAAGYDGALGDMAIYNPTTVGPDQYSAARIKLQLGPDSIEAGWRVDPKLYGDTKTHLYIRTDIRDAHCFNVLCPGFVITDRSIPLDTVLPRISTPEHQYGINMSIISDSSSGTGHWILRVGMGNIEIGYWPSYLFQKPGVADSIQWGGEVYGPEGTVKPGMGSGEFLSRDTAKDAFFDNVKVTSWGLHGDTAFDPVNVHCDSDIPNYAAKQEGNVGGYFQFLIYYGGPPTTR